METFATIPLRQSTHFVREGSSLDCMSQTLLSHDSQDNAFLDSWYCHEQSDRSLDNPALLKPLGPIFIEDDPQHTPQHHHSFGNSDLYLPSPPLTGSAFKYPATLPHLCDPRFMDSDPSSRKSLSRILTGSHDACCRPQPPSPPLDTPELIQRNLPDAHHPEPLSPPLTSPVDILDLPTLSTFDSPHGDTLDIEPEHHFRGEDEDEYAGEASTSMQRCCWDDAKEGVGLGATYRSHGHTGRRPHLCSDHDLLTPASPTWNAPTMLDPLFEDSAMDWSSVDGGHDFTRNLRVPLDPAKHRGNSLDSMQEGSYDFLAAMQSSSLRPRRRSFTTPPSFPSTQPNSPQLDDLWGEPHHMDIDDDQLSHSPRSPSLNLNLAGFDDPNAPGIDEPPTDPFTSKLLSASPLPPPPLDLFDEPSYSGLTEHPCGLYADDFVPSSPHSPHMQLLPSDEDQMVAEPAPTATISPSMLGLPDTDVGLGLDVDPGLDRSPSPSDYELQLLEGSVDVPLKDLPEDEFQQLRAYYEDLSHSEASAKERESVLDRRVKDISALLKPPKASPDPTVMRARRQEFRVATDLRAEARRVRKEEKHRLRELGALLDLKLETRVFHTKGSMRSVAHLVADMVFKRRDRSRALANRKVASFPRTSSPSLLCSSFTDDDLLSGDDFDSM